MKENVYFIEAADNERDDVLCERLKNLLRTEDLLGFIAKQGHHRGKNAFRRISEPRISSTALYQDAWGRY